jgi:hypothetical protein
VRVLRSEPSAPGSRVRRVFYSATVPIAWSKRRSVPSTLELILPARADTAGQKAFFDAYSPKCNDRDSFQELTVLNFFYHYRPGASGCALKSAAPEESGVVARVPVALRDSGRNTEDKSPEYGELWKDGKLVVTTIFGKYEPGATDSSDVGIKAYNAFYSKVRRKFGRPLSVTPEFDGAPGAARPEIAMTLKTGSGTIELTMSLVDHLSEVSQDWIRRYQARTQVSDVVIYNGHAGLGGNVRALSRMGKYKKGLYQLFVINGCDTFAYTDDTLFSKHGEVNPGFAPSKHLDLVTNAMPSYFHRLDDLTIDTLDSLVDQDDTYRDMLKRYDRAQRALVDGEEDNLWPQPFGP